jgi:hypothetical protein
VSFGHFPGNRDYGFVMRLRDTAQPAHTQRLAAHVQYPGLGTPMPVLILLDPPEEPQGGLPNGISQERENRKFYVICVNKSYIR